VSIPADGVEDAGGEVLDIVMGKARLEQRRVVEQPRRLLDRL
jgi:hypothetical protein